MDEDELAKIGDIPSNKLSDTIGGDNVYHTISMKKYHLAGAKK